MVDFRKVDQTHPKLEKTPLQLQDLNNGRKHQDHYSVCRTYQAAGWVREKQILIC